MLASCSFEQGPTHFNYELSSGKLSSHRFITGKLRKLHVFVDIDNNLVDLFEKAGRLSKLSDSDYTQFSKIQRDDVLLDASES